MRSPLALLVAAVAAALSACTSTPPAIHESLTPGNSQELACTPLLLLIHAEKGAGGVAVGCGSGVLVHPRIILTANHIIPAGPRAVTAFTSPESTGEAVRIQRVVHSSNSLKKHPTRPTDRWGDDWALIVLDEPLQAIDPTPVTELSDGSDSAPGRAVLIAGFPFSTRGLGRPDPSDRTAVLIRTTIIPRPRGVPDDPSLLFAAGGGPDREGASGGPVLALNPDGRPILIGIYLGRVDHRFIGIATGTSLIVQRSPLAEIRAAMAELENTKNPLVTAPTDSPPRRSPGSPN